LNCKSRFLKYKRNSKFFVTKNNLQRSFFLKKLRIFVSRRKKSIKERIRLGDGKEKYRDSKAKLQKKAKKV